MCGIAGFVRKDGAPAEHSVIDRMTTAVAHRGPDGSGLLVEGSLALGHRRLSILDLSDHGRQPMTSPDGTLAITYNGEIYNYIEIREELKRLGQAFRTGTDTEVLLGAYRQWGEDCLSRLNGMWSFAILDRTRNVLFMARDRFGVKPFYYIDTARVFAFGSEIRQLLPFLDRQRADMEAVKTFVLTTGAELGTTTFFADVHRLPGGHSAVYDLAGGTLAIRRYYAIARREEIAGLEEAEISRRFADLLEDAIRVRLRSDVKVGTCLSGGLDSSSVASIASALNRQAGGGRFAAITAVSEQQSNNEESYAGLVVQSADLDWHRTRPTYDDFLTSLDDVVESQEEPFASPSLTMQHFVMKTARENGIKVLLDGQGGDEMLLGYEKYYGAYILSILRSEGGIAALKALSRIRTNNDNMGGANLAKYLVGGLSAKARYARYRRDHRYFATFPPMPAHLGAFSASLADTFKLQQLEVTSTNLPILLRYEDKNSMAHGVEARLPFLDYRLVEFCLSVPDRYKIRDGWTKWLLRHAMVGRMPAEVTWRKNKFGFEAPEALWLDRHLPEMRRKVLASPLLGDLASPRHLKRAYDGLDMRSRWRLYSIALWEETFGVGS